MGFPIPINIKVQILSGKSHYHQLKFFKSQSQITLTIDTQKITIVLLINNSHTLIYLTFSG